MSGHLAGPHRLGQLHGRQPDRQVRNIAQVTTAVARGDLSQKITVDARGEILELKNTVNTMVDQLSSFADEVTRVAREVGTEGKLGGQAAGPGRLRAPGRTSPTTSTSWRDNLTAPGPQHRPGRPRRSRRATCRKKITVDARGEILELKTTVNTMVDQLSVVRRRGHPGGPRGRHRGQARRPGRRCAGVAGTWQDLTDNVNFMAVEPDRPGAQHRPGHDGGRQRRPVAEDHRRRPGRDPGAEEHRQHDGRPAVARSPTR